jgi:hypothetical protein
MYDKLLGWCSFFDALYRAHRILRSRWREHHAEFRSRSVITGASDPAVAELLLTSYRHHVLLPERIHP